MKQFGIGQPVRRVEDRRFITGHGNYVDDINRPHQAYAFMLRSPHAHARIGAIETAAALSTPGVLAVFTGEDLARDGIGTIPCLSALANRDGSPSVLPPYPAIARGRVSVVRGERSREKVVRVEGLTREELRRALGLTPE